MDRQDWSDETGSGWTSEQDDFELLYGIENEQSRETKQKI